MRATSCWPCPRRLVNLPRACPALLGLALLLTACAGAGPPKQTVQIEGLDFLNRSRSTIQAVRLLVPATGGFVSCAAVAPGARCASGFPALDWSGEDVEVTWSQEGQIWSTGSLELQVGEEARERGRARVQVLIVAPGSAGVLLVPVADAVGGTP